LPLAQRGAGAGGHVAHGIGSFRAMHFAYASSLRFCASADADFWMPTAQAHAGIMTSHSESDAHARCDWMKRSAAFFSSQGPGM
jgi:hypothetical protein